VDAPAYSLQSNAFNLEGVKFRYEPYPVGYGVGVFAPDVYTDLQKHWPATSLFEFKPELGDKFSLSELNRADDYHRFVEQTPCWRALRTRVKSATFVRYVIDFFARRGIDFGLQNCKMSDQSGMSGTLRRVGAGLRYAAGRPLRRRLSSRFEFSMLPAAGGNILPHTDSPGKIITLVLSMCEGSEWNPAWGGGTTILKPVDRSRSYNWLNRQLQFDECETVETHLFVPNQCVVFVKTYNSLHAVHPMTGPPGVMRRTLTINIEEVSA
jgi:hypothetical protein